MPGNNSFVLVAKVIVEVLSVNRRMASRAKTRPLGKPASMAGPANGREVRLRMAAQTQVVVTDE